MKWHFFKKSFKRFLDFSLSAFLNKGHENAPFQFAFALIVVYVFRDIYILHENSWIFTSFLNKIYRLLVLSHAKRKQRTAFISCFYKTSLCGSLSCARDTLMISSLSVRAARLVALWSWQLRRQPAKCEKRRDFSSFRKFSAFSSEKKIEIMIHSTKYFLYLV